MRNTAGPARRVCGLHTLSFAATVVLLVAGALNDAQLVAQSPSPDAREPRFDAASVKLNTSADGAINLRILPGRFTATGVPAQELIRLAYGLQNFQIAGAPGWLTSDRFDIVATLEGPSTRERTNFMLRGLLTDRFRLVVHTETRELPIYALVLARGDGRLGPQLRQSDLDCAALARARSGSSSPAPPAPPKPGERPTCATFGGPGRLAAGGVTMAQVAASLSSRVSRVVSDRTGLTGAFDLQLEWTPDQIPSRPAGVVPPDAPPLPPPDGPSLFTALQEQLGLKLESARGLVDVLVIDRVERPTEN